MKASFDSKGYFTGNYAIIGDIEGSIEVDSIPEESDRLKLTCYKYENNNWMFDNERYQDLLTKQQSKELQQLKQEMTEQNKRNLKEYLDTHKLISACHGGIEKAYSITAEKQQYLASMIQATNTAMQMEISYQPSWNAAGEVSSYDWTIEELQQLAIEIETLIRPLVLKQQKTEEAIKHATSLEELKEIDVSFD